MDLNRKYAFHNYQHLLAKFWCEQKVARVTLTHFGVKPEASGRLLWMVHFCSEMFRSDLVGGWKTCRSESFGEDVVQNSQGYQRDHLHPPDSDHLANSPVVVACTYAYGWGVRRRPLPHEPIATDADCFGRAAGGPRVRFVGPQSRSECLGRWNRND